MFERLLHVNGWVLFGMLGQVLFGLRFIVQWLASERRKETIVPVAFWYLSLAGSLILFVYAFWYRQDIVISIGQSAGVLIYVRNLMLIRRPRPLASQCPGGPGA
ncbi:MAG TPA: lipid-A-disaccharide synthase N-terminal domain-containing protein [Candidatus Dormibacteraeota bacterium]|nr:lipid-A-disaccharide synthase N-terminal domain-containing protein [Candidatus Dormibacteraeota bacterium]